MTFDWDKHNTEHLAKHAITPEEFEELLSNPHIILKDDIVVNGEIRQYGVGRTNGGKLPMFILASRSGCIRAVTGYPANRKMRSLYDETI